MIIAFDTSKVRTGWAFKKGETWIFGILPVDGNPKNKEKLRQVLAVAKEHGVGGAVIEGCYLGKNVASAFEQKEAQARIKCALEDAGIPYTVIGPKEWQSAYGITGKRADTKPAAIRVASHLGVQNAPSDIADAVCLADYAERIGKQTELAERAK